MAALVNVSIAGCAPFPALAADGRALALRFWSDRGGPDADACADIGALLCGWARAAEALKALCAAPQTGRDIAGHGVALDLLRLHAPVAPRQVYCTIGNYRCQLVEAALDADDGPAGAGAAGRHAAVLAAIEERRRYGEPYVCLKSRASVSGPHDALPIAPEQTTLDWEVELGVVIGRSAWQVEVGDALQHVAGYCVVNDITLRERVFRADARAMGTDWLSSKGHPGWLPAGPALVPAWQVVDPAQLRPWLRLNGATMQNGQVADMVFTIAEQIAWLSRVTRLEPGDLLCTGSPAGFGSHHRRFLRPGDVVEAGIDGLEGLDHQRVPCTALEKTTP